MNKILILLATYNGEKFIKDQIDSIFSQLDVDVDILISDHSSSDKTINKIIEAIPVNKKNNVNIIYLDNYKNNPGANFFHLIKNAADHYDFYALSDQDDIWKPKKLIRALKCIKKNNVSCYSSNYTNYNKKNSWTSVIYAKQKKFDHFFQTPGPGCTFVFSSNFFQSLKNNILNSPDIFNFKWHDWFIYAFSRSNNYTWFIDEESFIKYRQHNQNFVGSNFGFKAKIVRIYKIFNNQWISDVGFLYKTLKERNCLNFLLFLLKSFFSPMHTRREPYYGIAVSIIIFYSFISYPIFFILRKIKHD